jgi:hypothetical protein
MTHLTDDELVLHYYGEMESADERRAESHLSTCGACQQTYTRLQRVMAFVDSAPAVEAPPGFERTAWARLQPALPARRSRWLLGFEPTFGRLAWVGALVVVIAAAFVAGRLLPSDTAAVVYAPTPPTAIPAVASADQVRERILLVDLGDHLDRSQMVLVEIVSADTRGDVNISTEQARAQQLVAANRLYRQTALKTGDTAMVSLLDELERTLVDIAASPSTLSQDDLDQVRRRIESKGLLFKVRVVSSDVRDRQKADIQGRTGQRPLDTTKS